MLLVMDRKFEPRAELQLPIAISTKHHGIKSANTMADIANCLEATGSFERLSITDRGYTKQ